MQHVFKPREMCSSPSTRRGSFVNITERKKRKKKRNERENEMENILETKSDKAE